MDEEKFPVTLQETKVRFEKNGHRTLGIVFGEKFQKKPDPHFLHKKLEEGTYSYDAKDFEAIAMVHGEISGTYAVDIDFKGRSHTVEEAINVLFVDVVATLKKTLTVKTPKQGVHFIFSSPDGDYPKPQKYTSDNYPDVEIDIKGTHGYTLLPPSQHPEKQYGNYSFISQTLVPAQMRWKDVKRVLEKKGFSTVAERNEIGTDGKRYDFVDLVAGGYTRGSRRVKQKSLYIQKRIAGSDGVEAVATVRKINATCVPPFDNQEFAVNICSAESYYMNVVKPSLAKMMADAAAGPVGPGLANSLPPASPKKKSKKFNPYRAAKKIMEKNDYVTTIQKNIYHRHKGVYKRHGDLLISQMCRTLWEEMEIDTATIKEIVNIVMDETGYVSVDDFDANPNIINIRNGTCDLVDGVFTAGHPDPGYLSLVQYDVEYVPQKKCRKFLTFLTNSLEEDPVKITMVLEMMGLCFINKNIIEKAFIHIGSGSNGKSTLFNVLTGMLGIENITAKTIHDFETNRFAAAALEGKSANISADIGKKGIKNTELIKKIIGGDPIDCEEKFKGPFAMRPHATLIFSANELPEVDDSSDGFVRKFEMIKWEKQFYAKKRDMSLKDLEYDESEKSGILNLLFPIMKRLIAVKTLRFESSVELTRNEWVRESNSINKFIEDSVHVEVNSSIKKEELYINYIKYCKTGKFKLYTRQKFNLLIERLGATTEVKKMEGHPHKVWVGVMMKSDLINDDDNQEQIL